MPKAVPISIQNALENVKFLGNRTPETTSDEARDAFTQISEYRDGAIYLGHYAGTSAWERHSNGDEIVFVIEGETTLVLLIDDNELPNLLGKGELLVVPQNIWHRFITPQGVKIMAVTPQPTDHSVGYPESD
jgi:mannose-6-phosphate isomerase-like protein (cupin superfamily)